jgi:hypothetical protein
MTDKKGFGVALKLTFAGNNQLTHISTYVFGVVVVGCILVQMVSELSLQSYHPLIIRDIKNRAKALELLQQSPRYILDKRSKPNILRLLHHSNNHRICNPLPRVQHDRSSQYYFALVWILGHFHGCLFVEYL